MNELAERGETKNYSFSVLTKILKPGERAARRASPSSSPSIPARDVTAWPRHPDGHSPPAPHPPHTHPALGGGANEVTSSCNTLILGCISPLALHTANTRATLE